MGISSQVLAEIADGNYDLDRLAAVTGHPRKALVKAVQVLKTRGFVRTRAGRVSDPSGLAPGVYRLTDAGRAAAESGAPIHSGKSGERPRLRTTGLRERIWWHFHVHRVATLAELLSTHAFGNEKSAQANASDYLAGLARAGILRRGGSRPQDSRSLWVRVLDLGPMAPVVRRRAREVYDPNADRVLPMTPVDETKEPGDDASA